MLRANHGTFASSRTRGWTVKTPEYTGFSTAFSPRRPQVNPTGTKMLVLATNGPISTFNFGTPWKISTLTDGSDTFDIPLTTYDGMFVDQSGTHLYILSINDKVLQYDLGTPWSPSTATYVNEHTTTPDDFERGIFFSPDGLNMYIGIVASLGKIKQYTLSVAWDITTIAYESESPTFEYGNNDLYFQPDGRKAFRIHYSGTASLNGWAEYHLSTPWDISTATYELFGSTGDVTGTNTLNGTFAGTGKYFYSSKWQFAI